MLSFKGAAALAEDAAAASTSEAAMLPGCSSAAAASREAALLPGARRPQQPQADCFLIFCRTINVVTAISALLCMVAHGMALASDGRPLADGNATCIQLLRVYGMGVAVVIMALETEWPPLLDAARLLEWWVGRAVLQGLLVVMTLEVATPSGHSDFDTSLRLYRRLAGYCMLGCASFYFVGGCLCFGMIRRARYRVHAERLRVERDLEAQEARLGELKALLASYSKE
uniref:Uncharacterized protein n=1 Tax=Chlamydomonas euryale TaxID=1486919 RepID=A0A7R9V1N4_9CHLO|mmetsp:Transcript_14643/g.42874  ORF Transcript_14643/g.42874 Transcript_14643/m.42874 type:complete len:228 (+) Transcript_14643:309-992(+)